MVLALWRPRYSPVFSKRREALQDVLLLVDGAPLALEEMGDGLAQRRIADPVGAIGGRRHIAALDLVFALGETPLAEEVLFGRLAKGGTVLVDVKDGQPVFSYPDDAPPAKKKGRAKASDRGAGKPQGKPEGKSGKTPESVS